MFVIHMLYTVFNALEHKNYTVKLPEKMKPLFENAVESCSQLLS